MGVQAQPRHSPAPLRRDIHHPRWHPFPAPAPILLFKAKRCKPKDQFDFETALPHLNQEELHWLLRAIEKEFPQSHWVAEIIGHISASRAK